MTLAEDAHTRESALAILARPAADERPTIDPIGMVAMIAEERSDPISAARATMTTGWVWRKHPPVPLEVPIDWDGLSARDRTWSNLLSEWQPLAHPIVAYQRTGAKRFIAWALELALDWARQHPTAAERSPSTWNAPAVGIRAFRLAYLIDVGAREQLLDLESLIALVECLRLHFVVLAQDERFRGHSNHGIYQCLGQLAAARRLSELPEAADAAKQGADRLERLIAAHFEADGVHREHSPGYDLMVLQSLAGARASGLLSSPEGLARLAAAEDVLAWFIAPVGGVPPVGDSERLPPPGLDDTYFRSETARFALSEGRDGHAPSSTFRAFDAGGYVVARDRWAAGEDFRRSSYLLQSCGFHSRVHKHADDLSFVWYARGTDLLTDAGKFGYTGPRPPADPKLSELGFFYGDPRRIYVESTRAHNCVEVDGTSYSRRDPPYGSALVAAERDVASGVVFTECKLTVHRAVRLTRYLLHLPGSWIVVVDHAAGEQNSAHDLVQRFHLGPDLELVEFGSSIARFSIPLCEEQLIATQLTDAAALDPCRGQTEPELLGWNARHPGELLPNWTIAWRRGGVRAGVFAVLFALAPEGAALDASGRLNATGRRGQVKWRVGKVSHQLRWNLVEQRQFSYRAG